MAELYAGRPDVDLAKLVEELVSAKRCRTSPRWRYSDSGLRTRAAWERTWELQRQEDAIDALSDLEEGDPQRLTAGTGRSAEAGRDRGDPGAAQVHVEGFPQGHLLVTARQARRAQGAVHHLPGAASGRPIRRR